MTYFDCFIVGSSMFAIGWFLGALYLQNHGEEREKPEGRPDCQAWRLPVAASASAD
jgi:hypothetical protein